MKNNKDNKKLILTTDKEIKAVTDPYRVNILFVLQKNHDQPKTVKEIAEVLNEPHGKVYYHIKKLEDVGAVALTHTKKINGIVAKYYKIAYDELVINPEEADDGVRKMLVKNNVTNMLAKYYDLSKRECLEDIMTKIENEESSNQEELGRDVLFRCNEISFSKESYKSFCKELKQLMEKYTESEDLEGELNKTIFMSIYNSKK